VRRLVALSCGVLVLGVVGCGDDEGSVPEVPPADDVEAGAPPKPDPATFDYEEHLRLLGEATGIVDPPQTQMIRLLAPDEQGSTWEACMEDAGWDVSVTFDGGLAPPTFIAPTQADAYELANYICHAQYPVDQRLFRPWGPEQVARSYRYFIEFLVPCLEAAGYSVSPIPSEAAYIEAFGTQRAWAPYMSVDASSLSEDEWVHLNLTCPQSPPDDLLFSDS
jgi:hypothetical protein